MRDSRIAKMAKVIVSYSLGVKKGKQVLMTGELLGMPLMEAIYEECIKVGAFVKTTFHPARWTEILFNCGSDAQIERTCPYALNEVSTCDYRIRVIAPENTRAFSNIDPSKLTLFSKSGLPIMKEFMERSAKNELEWVVTLCPTASGAQEAEMGILEYEDFVFNAGYLNIADPVKRLLQAEKEQQKMVDFLTPCKQLHFKTPQGTDLKVNIEKMIWRNSCGKRNYPDGEVFTGPNLKAHDGGVNGIVKFTFPAIWHNIVVENVELHFEKGKVVKAYASKNQEYLRSTITQDEGASYLGEIAIGTNYGIKKFTKNILFDEKIGGTFHAALGMGYPETGNTNKSALHWDMICDLREGGTIEADGKLISENGRFLDESWPKCVIVESA